jgi:DNA-binding NarL/FixJ family response regulator
VKLALADSSKVFRMGMRALLAEAGDVMVVADVADGAGVLAAVETQAIDVVVCDLELADRSAILLASALREVAPATRVLVLAAGAIDSTVKQTLLAGVIGYALKSQTPAEILTAIREVSAGRRVLPPRHEEAVGAASGLSHLGNRASALDRLSAREREIFDLIIWGQTNKQVAVKLGISVKTVETHRSHINGKLQVHSAAELVRLASLCGVLTAPGVAASMTASSLGVGANGGGNLSPSSPEARAPALVAKTG